MVKASIKVCIRARPTPNFPKDKLQLDTDHKTVQILINNGEEIDEGTTTTILNNRQNFHKFKFDDVFHNATQADVYDHRARQTVIGVVEGINGAILTYGQTGAGKTFTMLGDTSNFELRGLAPRAINQIFNEIASHIEYEYKVYCSYMEIYNDRIFDLLDDFSNPNPNPEFVITDEKEGRGVYIRNLNEIEVFSERDALNLLFGGELARTTATHKLNRRSNRSHAIFTIYIQKRQRTGSQEKIIHSKLNLVDLAGSERIKKTMDDIDGVTMGDEVTRKESMAINQSLSYLEQCVVALTRRGQTHIPYRQSKLTSILKDCLGANCNTLVFACVWGEETHFEETLSTLRFASRMMKVENDISQVETIDTMALLKKQSKEIKALKQELLMHDALVERNGILYEPLTPEQIQNIVQTIEKYIENTEVEEDIFNITSVRQMYEICKQFRQIIINTKQDMIQLQNEMLAISDDESESNPNNNNTTITTNKNKDEKSVTQSRHKSVLHTDSLPMKTKTIGQPDEKDKNRGFPLGVAPADARPMLNKIEPLLLNTKSNPNLLAAITTAREYVNSPRTLSNNGTLNTTTTTTTAGNTNTNNNNNNSNSGDKKNTTTTAATTNNNTSKDISNGYEKNNMSAARTIQLLRQSSTNNNTHTNSGSGNGSMNINSIASPDITAMRNTRLRNNNNSSSSTNNDDDEMYTNNTLNIHENTLSKSPQNILFDAYIQNEGSEKYTKYSEYKQYLKDIKNKLKELIVRVNESKRQIDTLNSQIEERKSSRVSLSQTFSSPMTSSSSLLASNISTQLSRTTNNNTITTSNSNECNNNESNSNSNNELDIVDADEFKLLKQLQDTKLHYKNTYIQYQKSKEQLLTIQSQVAILKQDLVDAYCEWSGLGSAAAGGVTGGQFLSIHELDDDPITSNNTTTNMMNMNNLSTPEYYMNNGISATSSTYNTNNMNNNTQRNTNTLRKSTTNILTSPRKSSQSPTLLRKSMTDTALLTNKNNNNSYTNPYDTYNMNNSNDENTDFFRSSIQSTLEKELEQQKTMADFPESIPFFDAQKTRKALLVQNNSSIKLMKKYKRLR